MTTVREIINNSIKFMVDVNNKHTFFGTKSAAIRACTKDFPILWVRANDSATLFFYDFDGIRRQKTYRNIGIKK